MDWLLRLLPKDYKWSVVIRKVGYGVAKVALAGLAYSKAQAIQGQLGIQIDPQKFQQGAAGLTIAGLEAAHDWAKLKYPKVSWL
jgi:hypothetical protein